MSTQTTPHRIPLNIDLTAKIAGFESADRPTAAHHQVAKYYSSPLLLGPPPSELLLELIMHMFNDEEADLVRHLKPLRVRTAVQVAGKAGRPVVEVRRVLDHLALKKAVILGYGDPRKYTLLPILPGTFEMALITSDLSTRNRWHLKFAELFERLWETEYFAAYPGKQKIAPVRYIPVGGVIDSLMAAWPSEKLEEILEPYDQFAVGHCQCRLAMRLVGKGCDRATENCVGMGPNVKALVERGMMRPIGREEVIQIKRQAELEGAVTFVVNSFNPKLGNASCSCCGCCCHALRAIKQFSAPGLVARPHFMPLRNPATCNLCRKCVKICPMEAWSMNEKELLFNKARCIGCGLCVTSCQAGALAMTEVEKTIPYTDKQWKQIMSLIPAYLAGSLSVWTKRLLARDNPGRKM